MGSMSVSIPRGNGRDWWEVVVEEEEEGEEEGKRDGWLMRIRRAGITHNKGEWEGE